VSAESFQQLGMFVFRFQQVESYISELILLLAKADEEMMRILMNELSFYQKATTCDVMFARFVDVSRDIDAVEKSKFHKVITLVKNLAERRNELVHSEYYSYLSSAHNIGLLRKNSKLRGKSGKREETEEVLFPNDFQGDAKKLSDLNSQLEHYRLQIIEWQYPTI
jgi:hypothetical protein